MNLFLLVNGEARSHGSVVWLIPSGARLAVHDVTLIEVGREQATRSSGNQFRLEQWAPTNSRSGVTVP